jgi:hypothetical protein
MNNIGYLEKRGREKTERERERGREGESKLSWT